MGYRGKLEARERAKALRALGWPLADIAAEVGASKGTVSVWVRDVAYRAAADPSLRSNKHEFGCVGVVYRSASTHRAVMGLVSALLSCEAIPG